MSNIPGQNMVTFAQFELGMWSDKMEGESNESVFEGEDMGTCDKY